MFSTFQLHKWTYFDMRMDHTYTWTHKRICLHVEIISCRWTQLYLYVATLLYATSTCMYVVQHLHAHTCLREFVAHDCVSVCLCAYMCIIIAGRHSLGASSCTCVYSYTKIEDFADPNIFECVIADQCLMANSCPNQNFMCFSDYATGEPRCVLLSWFIKCLWFVIYPAAFCFHYQLSILWCEFFPLCALWRISFLYMMKYYIPYHNSIIDLSMYKHVHCHLPYTALQVFC